MRRGFSLLFLMLLPAMLTACGSYKIPFSLAISPASETVTGGSMIEFTVRENVEDGSSIDVTATSTLVSSNPQLLTIASSAQNPGQATTSGFGGQVTVTASFENHTAVATITINPAPTINAWGDNLTAGVGAVSGQSDYPTQLGALLSRATANFGIAGQKSTQIAMREGGVASTLTIDGNSLAAGGTPVQVDDINGVAIVGMATAEEPDFRLLSTVSTNAAISETGTVGGFHGTLIRSGAGGTAGSTTELYTFTQDADAVSQTLPGPAAFVPDTGQTLDQVAVFWMGNNNFSDSAQVLKDIAAAVAYLGNQKFLVLGILNSSSEAKGTTAYNQIVQLNTQLKQVYGAQFIDIRTTLVAAFNPTDAQDTLDHQNDVPPTSLRSNSIDLNAKGYGVVAETVAQVITANHW